MSKSCCLWIANNSGHRLKLNGIGCHHNSMKSWDFSDVNTDVHQSFQVEFSNDVVETGEFSGLAEFVLEGTRCQFQLQAICSQKCNYVLQVDWTSMDLDVYSVFPPPESSKVGSLGWDPSCLPSCLCLTIQKKLHHDIHHPTDPLPPVYSVKEWMGYYGDVIGSLSLREMTLPSAHNSGSYEPTTQLPVLPRFIRCQAHSISSQLILGIRVLDLRIAQIGVEEYVLSHNRWTTRYTLKQALREVVEFIYQTSKEIVILDCHLFNNQTRIEFNYSTLKAQVKGFLEDHYLPMFDGALDLPLHDLWSKASTKSRVVVAWNHESRDEDMWPGVYHEWFDRANSESKLHEALDQAFSEDNTSRHKGLWCVCVFQTPSLTCTPLKNAKDLQNKMDTWFHGCAEWTLKANIISTDFTGDWSNIIQATICANLLKGANRATH